MSPESLSTLFKSNKRKPEVPKKPEALNPEKKEKSQEELRAILQERLLALKDPIRQGMDEYQKARIYTINPQIMSLMKKKSIVMHPLPRVDEITKECDNDSRAAYFRQARNGLYVRMAILRMLLD